MHINKMLRNGIAMLLAVVLLTGCGGTVAEPGLPEVDSDPALKELAAQSAQKYKEDGWSHEIYMPDGTYDPFGSYLNWSDCREADFVESDRKHFDENGCIMVLKNGEWTYSPVTTAQWALYLHGKYLSGKESKENFLKAARILADMVGPDGALRYPFQFTYYVDPEHPLQPGWVSAMAQGQALSVFARAYQVSDGDEFFAQAGARTLDFLGVPIEDGGAATTLEVLDPLLKDYVILEEYPYTPPTYTLNGFQFTATGLYDWSMAGTDTSDEAGALFEKCMDTMEVILPYYDMGGFTCYDLGHITLGREEPHIGINYHAYHTVFCLIFYQITGRETFNTYYERWAGYVS
ncbi:MAG: hypothetical protein IKX81_03145 [Firmicutes bacterium]|nr:hypothetical protein [Bacillota bacterium]